jgi:hypothetical protein
MPKKHKPTIQELEKKFSETAFRLTQERSDFLLPQVKEFVTQRKWINLRPEYQRRTVWDDQKRSLFIESLLLNVPIPPVFLYEWELSRYEVMDGQQRLNAIVDFYDNGFPLRGLERWHDINGSRFRDLPETLQRGLDRRRISATVLVVGSAEETKPDRGDIRKLVFERLNTGGQQLNAQELRNCLYAGPFNELLIKLSSDPVFTAIWEIPSHEDYIDKHGKVGDDLRKNSLYRRMLDCELVLRFFALRRQSNIRGAVKVMLDRSMEEHQNAAPAELATFEADFKERIRLAQDIFGAKTFRFPDNQNNWQLSQPLYDAVMVALDRLWDKRRDLVRSKAKVTRGMDQLFKDERAFEVIAGKPNTARAVLERMSLVTNAISAAL